MVKLLEFEPNNEIDCFATDINETNFILSSMHQDISINAQSIKKTM